MPTACHTLRDNRAFQYGDGFFETIRVCNGFPSMWNCIGTEWRKASKRIALRKTSKLGHPQLGNGLESLCQANGVDAGGRLRVSFFRMAGGRYTPQTNALEWIAEVEPLDSNVYTLNENGLAVDVYPDMKNSMARSQISRTHRPCCTSRPVCGPEKKNWTTH